MIKNVFVETGSEVRVHCDICEAPAQGKNSSTLDAAEAAEFARKKCGFITAPGARPSSPMMWLCSKCARPQKRPAA